VLSFFDFFRPPISFGCMTSLYLLHSLDLSESRRMKLRTLARHWREAGCNDNMRRVTTTDFARLRQHLLQTMQPVTIESYVAIIVTMLRHLGPRSASIPHALGLLREVPYAGQSLVYSCAPKPPADLDHLRLLYETSGQISYAPRGLRSRDFWRAFFVLAYNTGLRFSDLTDNLSWSMVDLEKQIITIQARKTGKLHLLPIVATLAEHLLALDRPGELVIPVPPRSCCHMRKQLREHCAALGLPHVLPQAIRRAAGEEYERAHPGAGGLLLGHTLPSATGPASNVTYGHYLRALETVLRPASKKIPQPWGVASAKGVSHDLEHDATQQTDSTDCQPGAAQRD